MKLPYLITALTIATGALGANSPRAKKAKLTDEKNPWFIQNTYQINYCIEIDEDNFGLKRQSLDWAIDRAAEYWQRQFLQNDPWPENEAGLEVVLGTQEFFEVPCDRPDVDLVLQFGVLKDDQREAIPFPNQTVSAAIRTTYDPRILKGKGFIYVAPAYGRLALRGMNVVENPWSNIRALELILMHELGHVYGVPNAVDEYSLMNPNFPRWLVTDPLREESKREVYLRRDWIAPSLFTYGSDEFGAGACNRLSPDLIKKFVGLEESIHCLHFRSERSGEMQVSGYLPSAEYGHFATGSLNPAGTERIFLGQLVITAEQQVFDFLPETNLSLKTYFTEHRSYFGKTVSNIDHIERPIFVDLYPSLIRVRSTDQDGQSLPSDIVFSRWEW
jgi:hypothetical protein